MRTPRLVAALAALLTLVSVIMIWDMSKQDRVSPLLSFYVKSSIPAHARNFRPYQAFPRPRKTPARDPLRHA